MKNKFLKKLSLLALSLILVLTLSACGGNGNTNSDDKASSNDGISQLESDLMPSQNDNSGMNSANSQQNSQNGGNSQNNNSSMNSANSQQNSQNGGNSQNNNSNTNDTAKITKDEAKKIALKDANLKESEIRDFDIELDRDNGVLKYEISFEKGNDDYDYDIDANTGKIINKKKDIND